MKTTFKIDITVSKEVSPWSADPKGEACFTMTFDGLDKIENVNEHLELLKVEDLSKKLVSLAVSRYIEAISAKESIISEITRVEQSACV